MTAATVHVSNIAPGTSERDVTNFFSFCGKITNISVTPTTSDPNSPLSATITFERETAAKTAVLLDGTPLNNVPIRVEPAHNIDEIAGSHLAPSGDLEASGDVPQESKPASAVMAEYLAAGYNIADSVLQKAIEFDKQHQFTSKFASYLQSVLQTVESKVHVAEKAKQAESSLHLTEKAKGLARYFEKALETGAGQKVREFYQTSEKQALDIHNEAKRLAELKIQKKRELGATANIIPQDQAVCTCGGQEGPCTCKPGTCACEGCSKASCSDKPVCTCGGQLGPCTCKPGTCTCEGCAKASCSDKVVCTCGGQEGPCTCKPGTCTCEGCANVSCSHKAEAEAKASPLGQAQHAFQDIKGTSEQTTQKI